MLKINNITLCRMECIADAVLLKNLMKSWYFNEVVLNVR